MTTQETRDDKQAYYEQEVAKIVAGIRARERARLERMWLQYGEELK